MKKLICLFFSLCSGFISNGQIIQNPSQSDYCTNQLISFSYNTPPPQGAHYEWMYEDYSQGWTASGPNVVFYSTDPTFSISSSSFGFACVVRLLIIDDLTGNLIQGDSRFLTSSLPSGNVPVYLNYAYNGCGALEVPPMLDPWGSWPNRWAMWYKNGQPTGITSYMFDQLYDSAWYEYKVRLNCGDTITTGLIFNQGTSLPVLNATGTTTICTGDSVELTLTASAPIDNWYKDGVVIAGSNGKSSLKVGQTGNYTARTKKSSVNGGYCYRTSNAISVAVNPGAFITGIEQFCGGDSVQLTCTSATSYQWKRNGVNVAGGNSQSIWVKTSGNYTVNTSGLTCNASPVKVVTNFPVPLALSLTPSGSIGVCDGNTTVISITGNNITSWQWQRNGINIPGATDSDITVVKSGNYRCVVTNSIGCSRTSGIVTVNTTANATLPQKTLVLQPGSEGTDSYTTSAFGSFGANFGNATTIEISNWHKYFRTAERGYLRFDLSAIPDLSAVLSATLLLRIDTINIKNINSNNPNSLYVRPVTQNWEENTISWNSTPATTDYLSVQVPCSTITSKSYKSISITDIVRDWVNTIGPDLGLNLNLGESNQQVTWLSVPSSDHPTVTYRPKLTIIYYAADINASGITNLCTGGNVTFTTNSGPYTYQWYRNGLPINGATNVNYTATTGGDYHVVLSIASGCTARSLVKKVTVNGVPQINLSPAADSTISCSGAGLTLQADSLPGYTFQWKKNNVNISGAIYSSYKPTSTGWYKIRTTSNCSVSGADSIYVTRVNNPTPVISAGGPTTFCQGQNVFLNSTTYSGATTKWYRGTTLVATATGYTASVAGAYSVVQSANGCSKTSNTINVIVNCKEGEFFSSEILQMEIYPNPSNGDFQVELEGIHTEEEHMLVLTDLAGKIIQTQMVTNSRLSFSCGTVGDGMYLLSLFHNGKMMAAKRLMIQH